MFKKVHIGIILFLLFHLTGWAQIISDKEWTIRGEQKVTIPTQTFYKLNYHPTLSVDRITDSIVVLYVNQKQYYRLISEGITPLHYQNAEFKAAHVMANSIKEAKNWDSYPTYDAYIAMMQELANCYPMLCQLDTIGFSNNNRLILAMHFTANSTNDSLPAVFLSSSMHGDELTGYVLMLRLAYYLAENYETNPEITALLNQTKICINPLANPDGAYFTGNHTVSGAIRGNSNYIDLNRNFPDPAKGKNPDGNLTQTENQAMITFMQTHEFNLSVNFHGGEEVINYPWDYKSQRHPDDAWFQLISHQYADSAHVKNPNYLSGFNNGITNGYDWYQVWGGRQDFMTYFLHGREVTAEISMVKSPKAIELPMFWEYNYVSFLNYIKQADYGFKGRVTNSSGNPINAIFELTGHDTDSSQTYTNSHGYYHRFVKANSYTITIKAKGYKSQTVTNVSISDFETKWLSFVLEPDTTSAIVENLTCLKLFPNPASKNLTVAMGKDYSGLVTITLTNLLGQVVLNYNGNMLKGQLNLDLATLPPGLYITTVLITNQRITQNICIE